MSRIASAKMLLSSVLLSVSVKEIVQENDHAECNSQVAKYHELTILTRKMIPITGRARSFFLF